jgi:PiT family inorganic phosphate transporter
LLVAVVVAALVFDFTNGFHDSANAIATSVATRALRPRTAVLFAAALNLLGALISVEVAATLATGIVDADVVTLDVVFAALVGAIAWNLFTWYFGLPSSSSHSLIGGVIGAAVAVEGVDVVAVASVGRKVVAPSVAAPLVAVGAAAAIVIAILWACRGMERVRANRVARRLQVASAGLVAFAHGTNDAQKTMGVVTLALIAAGGMSADDFHVPLWVVLSSAIVMALGTYVGGWRIIRTLGTRVVHLDPHQGLAAEAATAAVLFTTAQAGAPVSTTHTIGGAILGGGAAQRPRSVRWRIARDIVAAWTFTIPAAGLVSAGVVSAMRSSTGLALLAASATVAAAAILESRARAHGRLQGRRQRRLGTGRERPLEPDQLRAPARLVVVGEVAALRGGRGRGRLPETLPAARDDRGGGGDRSGRRGRHGLQGALRPPAAPARGDRGDRRHPGLGLLPVRALRHGLRGRRRRRLLLPAAQVAASGAGRRRRAVARVPGSALRQRRPGRKPARSAARAGGRVGPPSGRTSAHSTRAESRPGRNELRSVP